MSNNLVPDALEFYDKNCERYDNLFDRVKYIKFVTGTKDMDPSYIHMYDEDKKEIIKSRYENIGVYNNKSKTWAWAWSMPRFSKNTTNIARKIINYGMDLSPDSQFLKMELITSRFRISDHVQLEMHVAIASYLSKKPLVYEYISYINFKLDADKLIDITDIREDDRENYTSYFLFLLDYEEINKEFSINRTA